MSENEPAEYPVIETSKEIWSGGRDEKKGRRWRNVKLWRVVLLLGIVFGGVGIVSCGFCLLKSYFLVRSLQRNNPELYWVPGDISDHGLAVLQGPRIFCGKFSIQIAMLNTSQTRSFREGCGGRFNEVGATFLSLDSNFFIDETQGKNAKSAKDNGKALPRSNYELLAAAMDTTPDQVKWWHSPWLNQRVSKQLTYKFANLRGHGKIYRISQRQMRGFQFGDPMVAPYEVTLELFDQIDRPIHLFIGGVGQNQPVSTQAEINALVASIQTQQ